MDFGWRGLVELGHVADYHRRAGPRAACTMETEGATLPASKAPRASCIRIKEPGQKAAELPRRAQFQTAIAAGLVLIPLRSSRGASGRVDGDLEAELAFVLLQVYISLLCFSVRAAAVAVIPAALLGSLAHRFVITVRLPAGLAQRIRLLKAEDGVIRDCAFPSPP